MVKEEYAINKIYQGGYDSLDPNKNPYFTGYTTSASSIGTSINPQTANQLGEINRVLNQGFVPVEMGTLSQDIFESIPKQHFKELNRVSKLTGSKITMHAPIQVEASGLTQQGWSEANRRAVENQLKDVINKSFELSDKGGTPVTFHASGIGGTEYYMEDGKKKEGVLVAINKETFQMVPLKEDIRYYPDLDLKRLEEGKGEIFDPQKSLNAQNVTQWDNSISAAIFKKNGADEILENIPKTIPEKFKEIMTGDLKIESLTPTEREVMSRLQTANAYLEDTKLEAKSLFNKAYKYGNEKQKKALRQIAEAYQKQFEIKPIRDLGKMSKKESDEYLSRELDPIRQSKAMEFLLTNLKHQQLAPEIFVPVEDFAIENSSKTFGNVAIESYKRAQKLGKDPSLVSIENLYPGMAFSESGKLNQLVDRSRDEFVKTAVKENLMSESEARKKADEIIGVTFDLGHLNIARKHGFSEKDLLKEAEAIAKNVKHVHITDNFGYTDSHLAPGMGNAPIKKIMEAIEKEGFKGTKIVEAGGIINHFKESPFMYALAGLGAPISQGDYSGVLWGSSYGLHQGYFGGYGSMLPQSNYNMFGAGFSQLPAELGGNTQAGRSRMGGNPME
jgi:hypothetical protein